MEWINETGILEYLRTPPEYHRNLVSVEMALFVSHRMDGIYRGNQGNGFSFRRSIYDTVIRGGNYDKSRPRNDCSKRE
ncbi:MAG: hypothetical protein ACI8UX_000181 [Psychromonas sp.]|jgi:hypothetical protein